MKIKILLLIYTFVGVFTVNNSFAYDSDEVHPRVNLNAIKHSENLQRQLTNLGFDKGIDSIIYYDSTTGTAIKVSGIFESGSTKEDEPIWRAFNHFHDPLLSWKKAGLKN